MQAREGALVIADISGYTAFVAGTELEHSRDILSELMDVMLRSVTPRLRVVQVEGDALFCVCEPVDPALVDLVEASFIAFHRRLRDIKAVTTCPCEACRLVGTLTLKFIGHYGRYLPQRVAKTDLLLGADVNLVHRLAKNTVPSHEYVLATERLLQRLPDERRGSFVPHTESYPDVGTVAGGYRDLAELRRRAYVEERKRVAPEEARMRTEVVFAAPLADVWWMLTDPEAFRRWSQVQSVELRPGARGTLYGAEYHCRHGKRGEQLLVFRVVGVDEPSELTMVARHPLGIDVYFTYRLTELEGGRTSLRILRYWEREAGLRGALRDATFRLVRRLRAGRIAKEMRAILAERPRAG